MADKILTYSTIFLLVLLSIIVVIPVLLVGALAFSVIILGIGIVLVINLLWQAIDNIWMIGLFALFLILIIKG